MTNPQNDIDVLIRGLGAAAQDAETGNRYTALYSQDGSLDDLLGPGGDEQAARALWGLDWDALKAKGLELWNRVSPEMHRAFCNPTSAYHKTFADLLSKGQTGVSAALAALIIQALGITFPVVAASAVAFFLAKLILTTFVTQGYDMICEEWESQLAE